MSSDVLYKIGISYRKLLMMLAEKEIIKQEFREELGIVPGTMAKLNIDQKLCPFC